MASGQWPPPGFPIIHGDYNLTDTWMIHLPGDFCRRVEDGSLVLWRPGLTIWMVAWNNDNNQTVAEKLAWIKEDAAPTRFAERESVADGIGRYSFRLRDENDEGVVESLYAFAINEDGHLQIAVYFDDVADEETARAIVESVGVRRRK